MHRALIRPALIAAVLLALAAPCALALEIRKSGKITVPPDVGVVAFSTDALVADRLRQDFDAEHRGADANAVSPVTLSVTVSESPLRPGVSLEDIAPGDPDIGALLKSAGATPPPVGDTGTEVDEVALARARAQNRMLPPGATPMQNLMNQLQGHGDLGPPPADPSAGCAPGMPCAPPATASPPPGTPGYTGDTCGLHVAGVSRRRPPRAAFVREGLRQCDRRTRVTERIDRRDDGHRSDPSGRRPA